MYVLAALWVLGSALLLPPVSYGDAPEYLLMSQSLFSHLTPELRQEDLRALTLLKTKHLIEVNFEGLQRAYFLDRRGHLYCYHFWGYSLLILPAKSLLRILHGNELKAHQITNAFIFLVAMHQLLFSTTPRPERRLIGFVLHLFSPVLWLMRWPHPEVVSMSFVTLALVRMRERRLAPGLFFAALASMQSPPLAFFASLLWLRACLEVLRSGERAWRLWARPSLAILPALLPPAFFLWRFGTPSLLAQEATRPANLSVQRTLELFFDLNIGMLPYVPLTLSLFLAAVAFGLTRLREGQAANRAATLLLLVVMAASCTVTGNWNHGTSGPSRYVMWMLPFVFSEVMCFSPLGLGTQRLYGRFLLIAAALQVIVVLARGGPLAEPDHLDHSYAAKLVLHVAPRLYNPSVPIFVTRTLHGDRVPGPAIYRDGKGCRKALLKTGQREELEKTCGAIPPGHESFFRGESSGLRWRSQEWIYVDY